MPPKRKVQNMSTAELAGPPARRPRKARNLDAAPHPLRRSKRGQPRGAEAEATEEAVAKQDLLLDYNAVRDLAKSSEDEDDELLLTPAKTKAGGASAPARSSTPDNAKTRAFMHSVEITTPRWLAKAGKDAGSPGPSSRRSLRSNRQDPAKLLAAQPELGAIQEQSSMSLVNSTATSSQATSLFRRQLLEGTQPEPATPRSVPIGRPQSLVFAHQYENQAESSADMSRLPDTLPDSLHASLAAQKRAILRELRHMPQIEDEVPLEEDELSFVQTNDTAFSQICELLKGTANRGEGNSCLIIGPRGSGKTRLVDRALDSIPEKPIVIRLSGQVQTNDRLAIREMARQLATQTGTSALQAELDQGGGENTADQENPFVDTPDPSSVTIALPPPAHLLALISSIPTLPRPTIVIIDAFDLFAAHPRQSLLYCLFDTVQSCRVTHENKGLAVIGVTTRVDTINLLEKRVKSRFSGRMIKTAHPSHLSYWTSLARTVLCPPLDGAQHRQWNSLWAQSVDRFLQNETVGEALNETFALTRDVAVLSRLLTDLVLRLTATSSLLSPDYFSKITTTQRCPPRHPFLSALPYPAICIFIAIIHTQATGHETFTFEMLHECFRDQVRTSQSAPVQVEGGSIGMVRCSRDVMLSMFERLVALRLLVPASLSTGTTAKQFLMYRSQVEKSEVKVAVDKMGQTSLKKWFNKA